MLLCRRPRIFDVDLAGAFALCLLAALTWFALLRPLDHRCRQERTRQLLLEQQNLDLQAQLDRLRDSVAQRRTLADTLRQTQDVLERSTGMAGVVHSLHSLAADSGLRLEEVEPDDPQAAPRFLKTPATLRLSGPFPCLRDFMHRARTELPYVWPRSLTLESRSSDDETLCDATIDVDVFTPVRLANP
jgi:Tfp pilus assembly protein PilO